MTQKELPLILVSNDDGVDAPGIQNLIETLVVFAKVVVVAPNGPQSAKSHAMSINQALYYQEVTPSNSHQNLKVYSCSGTPVDCIKLALHGILEQKPDLCVSGINHGSNHGINVIYSGTMAAALEAGMSGIPAIGFSLLDYDYHANFKPGLKYVKEIVMKVLENKLPKDVVLNVNIPKLPENKIKGIKVCRQIQSRWEETIDIHEFPMKQHYYWLSGTFLTQEPNTCMDTDHWALENGYVSVVPTQFDFTAHAFKKELENWNW